MIITASAAATDRNETEQAKKYRHIKLIEICSATALREGISEEDVFMLNDVKRCCNIAHTHTRSQTNDGPMMMNGWMDGWLEHQKRVSSLISIVFIG